MVKVYSVSPGEMEEFIGHNGRLGRPDKVKEPWEVVAEAEAAEIASKKSSADGRQRTASKFPWEVVAEVNERAVQMRGGERPKDGPLPPRFIVGRGRVWNKDITRYRPEEGDCPVCHDRRLPPQTGCLCCNATDADPVQWPMTLTEEQEARRLMRQLAKEVRAKKKARKKRARRLYERPYVQATLAEIAPEAGNQISEIFAEGDIRNDENGGLNVTPGDF